MVTSSGQTESIEDVIDVEPGSGCRFSGMEAPAEVEWSTAGKRRRRPAQPAAVLTGSASPPLPCKAIPAKNVSDASVRGRSGPGKATAAAGAYLRVSGP